MADRWRDVEIPGDYFRLPIEIDFHTRYMETKFNALTDEEKFWIAVNQETNGVPVYESLRNGSDFMQELKGARSSHFSTEAHGKFAHFLEYLELREEGAEWEVGDTGEASD